MATLVLLFLGFYGSAQAQQPAPPPNIEGQSPDSSDRPADATPADEEEQSSSRPMTLDDARTNFSTIVESFVVEHSPDGYWPLRQKTTGKVLKLKFESILPKSVRDIKDGRFMGRAVLRGVAEDLTVKADFTVDFSGPQWKVEGMRLVSVTPAAPKTRREAPVQPPAEKKTAVPN